MKLLNGAELADFIKERQAKTVRSLRQAHVVEPKLAIIRTNPAPVVDTYMRLKTNYGRDILVDVEVHNVDQSQATITIQKLNEDNSVHGIIVQLPLVDASKTNEVLNSVAAEKDVDGLAKNSNFDSATPMAINWLLAGYNIDLNGKKIVIVGNGRLVGHPLSKMWQASGLDVKVTDEHTTDLASLVRQADVIVSAAGVPALITDEMVNPESIIVDAGVATDGNKLVGDVDTSVRQLPNITITPEKGGVGPLTICALFENVIQAALQLSHN